MASARQHRRESATPTSSEHLRRTYRAAETSTGVLRFRSNVRFAPKRGNSGRRGGPHQEDRFNAVEACIKSVGKSEISANHLNLRWQSSSVWVARERTDLHARGRQSRENLAADGSGSSNNENTIHGKTIIRARCKGIKAVLGGVAMRSCKNLEARGGIEPPIKVLQTFALPLGDRATG